jgi:shikimate kinase
VSGGAATAAGSVVVASAPGRVLLSGAAPGPRVSVALDRRAECRVETSAPGVVIEAKDALTKTAAPDVAELVAKAPGSIAARVLELADVRSELRLVTEWKLPAGSGVDGDSALAVAATAAVARILGRKLEHQELLRLAREASRRAGRRDEDGHHGALWGGVVLTEGAGDSLAAKALGVDPGRIEEALLLVDAGEAGAEPAPPPAVRATGLMERVVAALVAGRSEELVALLGEEAGEAREGPAPVPGAQRVLDVVRAAGGAARSLPQGRLVAVWAPPGARGPGRGEAVREALKAAGLKPVAIRVDLRGLDVQLG